jgi:hypothetical protein
VFDDRRLGAGPLVRSTSARSQQQRDGEQWPPR